MQVDCVSQMNSTAGLVYQMRMQSLNCLKRKAAAWTVHLVWICSPNCISVENLQTALNALTGKMHSLNFWLHLNPQPSLFIRRKSAAWTVYQVWIFNLNLFIMRESVAWTVYPRRIYVLNCLSGAIIGLNYIFIKYECAARTVYLACL